MNRASWSGGLVVGHLVRHFAYDGYGRLVRVQSPYPEPGADAMRSERLYYDGVRRVQEVYVDPVVVMNAMLAGDAGAAMQAAASAHAASAAASGGELDGSATPTTLESLLEEEEEEPLLVYLAREYVWGPGDWGPISSTATRS